MYNYKIKFIKKPKTGQITDEKAAELIESYFNPLLNNGQVLCGYDLYKDSYGFLYANVILPEEDSLSGVYDNGYVKEYRKKLNEFFDTELIREGINLEYHEPCDCKKPSWYFLYIDTPWNNETPLICGDCSGYVPLYKVPYISDEKEHFSLLSWRIAYQSMERLWIHSLWDRFTYGQVFKYDSKLNIEGRKLSRNYEKVLSTPVYYYIDYNVRAWIAPKKPPETCPECCGEWIKDPEFFKCEKCRLITTNPDWKDDE